MINTIKDKLHQLAIRKMWYSTVYTGKITIHKTVFGKYFTETDYMSAPLNRLITSEVARNVRDTKDEFVEAYLREKEHGLLKKRHWDANDAPAIEKMKTVDSYIPSASPLNIKGILPD
jgi:hypothetical protein